MSPLHLWELEISAEHGSSAVRLASSASTTASARGSRMYKPALNTIPIVVPTFTHLRCRGCPFANAEETTTRAKEEYCSRTSQSVSSLFCSLSSLAQVLLAALPENQASRRGEGEEDQSKTHVEAPEEIPLYEPFGLRATRTKTIAFRRAAPLRHCTISVDALLYVSIGFALISERKVASFSGSSYYGWLFAVS